MSHDHDHDGPHQHDLGLSHDLPTVLNRRRALGLLSAAGLAAALAACGASSDSSVDPTKTPSTPTTGSATTDASIASVDGEVPEETGGPFPADNTNGVNVLGESGIVRSDLTTSFAGASGVAGGIPMTLALTLLNMNDGDVAPYEGAAIYAWHCDREGRYSMYDSEIKDENYLRGVQAADKDGKVTFTSIVPGAYDGRWPHIHFEVYESAASAQKATGKLRTSQIALPEAACTEAYATSGYEESVANLARTSLDSDNVFSDGYSLQLAKAAGSVEDGFTISLTVAV